MSIPVWVLLAFAGWTLLALIFSVGVYRWSRILKGRDAIGDYAFPDVEDREDFYKRAMRAHANCIENLPVYAAIVVVLVAAGIESSLLDTLALVLIGARVIHTLVHISFEQTGKVVTVRFLFFATQVVCMFWMGGYIVVELV